MVPRIYYKWTCYIQKLLIFKFKEKHQIQVTIQIRTLEGFDYHRLVVSYFSQYMIQVFGMCFELFKDFV